MLGGMKRVMQEITKMAMGTACKSCIFTILCETALMILKRGRSREYSVALVWVNFIIIKI
jgi:hypothetical protein